MKKLPALLSGVCALMAACPAVATLISYESFTYTTDETLHSQLAWSGSSDYTIAAGSLGYTDAQGNVLNTSGGRARDVNAITSTGGTTSYSFASQTDDFWVSFIYNGTSNSTSLLNFDHSSTNTDTVQFEEGATNDSIEMRTFGGGVGGARFDDAGNTVARTGSVFYVVQFDFGATATEHQVNLWLNPADMANLGTPTGTIVSSGTSLPLLAAYDVLNLTAGPLGSGAEIDEIRIGTTSADVLDFTPVPEPSTYALLAGALALVCVMVRRRG